MSDLYLGRVPGGAESPAPAVRPSPYVGGDVKVCSLSLQHSSITHPIFSLSLSSTYTSLKSLHQITPILLIPYYFIEQILLILSFITSPKPLLLLLHLFACITIDNIHTPTPTTIAADPHRPRWCDTPCHRIPSTCRSSR